MSERLTDVCQCKHSRADHQPHGQCVAGPGTFAARGCCPCMEFVFAAHGQPEQFPQREAQGPQVVPSPRPVAADAVKPLTRNEIDELERVLVLLDKMTEGYRRLLATARAGLADTERLSVIEELIASGALHNGDYLEVPSPYALTYNEGTVQRIAPFSTLREAVDFVRDAARHNTGEGVKCVICGRWHSGVDVNDNPTTHCEACEPVIAVRKSSGQRPSVPEGCEFWRGHAAYCTRGTWGCHVTHDAGQE